MVTCERARHRAMTQCPVSSEAQETASDFRVAPNLRLIYSLRRLTGWLREARSREGLRESTGTLADTAVW